LEKKEGLYTTDLGWNTHPLQPLNGFKPVVRINEVEKEGKRGEAKPPGKAILRRGGNALFV